MSEQVKTITLPNGLRVILAPRRGSLASTVLVLVAAGSEYESKEINGISHFLEHMMFKGTINRPRSHIISEELDALGAEYNAFTGEEYTGYWAKAENHKLSQIFDLVSDIYLNPLFEDAEIEKEKGVIIEEINMYEDTPMDYIHRVYSELLYGDQPAGWKIEGRKEVIRSLGRDSFISYRDKHYVASKTVVTVTGDFNSEEIMAKISGSFGVLPFKEISPKPVTTEEQSGPRVTISQKPSAQTHMILGVRAFPVNDKRKMALKVLGSILGGGMSSRLFRKIRDELGAAYYIGAHADLSLDHGGFYVPAGIDHLKMDVVIKAVLQEMKDLRENPVKEAELRKAKDHMTGTFIMSLETSDEQANYYGAQEIINKEILMPEETVEKIQAVTADEIKSVAEAIFTNDRLNLAIIGPHSDEESLKNMFFL